ncbi:MAG: carbohydrate ABC transporter permease [Candidatus Methanomethyliaceae archaeon]
MNIRPTPIKKVCWDVTIYTGVCLLLMFILGPIIWTALTSLQSYVNLTSVPPKITLTQIDLYYYKWLFGDVAFRRALLQSITVVGCATCLGIVLAALGAYALGTGQLKGKSVVMFLLLSVQLVPALTFLIPLFLMLRSLQLVDTFVGLVVVFLLFQAPVGIWMLRPFFESIPKEVFDAARIDGCSTFAAFLHVAVPLARPGLFAIAIYLFITGWGDLLIPLTVGIFRYRLITVYASAFGGLYQIDYGGATAVATISAIPSIILAIMFRKQLIEGLIAGAVKG